MLFVNPRSGGGKAAAARLPEQARERGIEAVVVQPEQSLASLAREAAEAGADGLGMAGGDGSLSVVAAVALEHDLPFVCVPAGTRNHFALDLGIARRDLVGSLDAFGEAVQRRIDVGTVNGRPFLNNASLGIYGDAVRRASYRDARLRTLVATADEVSRGAVELAELRLVDDEDREHRGPALVLVSNNPYELRPGRPAGTRPALDGGRLGVVVLDSPRDAPSAVGRAWDAATLHVDASEAVYAGIDGESVELAPPLEFASRPRALLVRLSPRHPGVSPSGRLLQRGS